MTGTSGCAGCRSRCCGSRPRLRSARARRQRKARDRTRAASPCRVTTPPPAAQRTSPSRTSSSTRPSSRAGASWPAKATSSPSWRPLRRLSTQSICLPRWLPVLQRRARVPSCSAVGAPRTGTANAARSRRVHGPRRQAAAHRHPQAGRARGEMPSLRQGAAFVCLPCARAAKLSAARAWL